MRSSATVLARSAAIDSVSAGPTPSRIDQPGPDLADHLATRATDPHTAAGDSLEERPHGWLGGAITPRSRMNAARQASASPR